MKRVQPLSADRLDAFSKSQWETILSRATLYECKAGERLHEQGEVDDRLILLLCGKVGMNRAVGRQENRTGILKGRGETLSNSGFYLQTPRALSSVVYEDGTRILVFHRSDVFALCSEIAEFTDYLFRNIAGQLYNTLDYVRQLRELSADKRVALRVLELFRSYGEVPVTQAELGEIVGVSRVTVSKSLAELDSLELVARRYGRIDVIDEEGLERWISPNLPVLGGNV